MKEKGRAKKSKEGFHDLRNRVEWEREGNDLFLPNKAGWAEDLQRTVVAELGSGRGPPVLNDLRVGSDHFLYLIETGLGQIFGFTGIGLQIIELNEDWIFQFLVVFGGSAKLIRASFQASSDFGSVKKGPELPLPGPKISFQWPS